MGIGERLVQLTLRAKDFLSRDVQPASDAIKELAEESKRLKTALDEAGHARSLARTLRDNEQAADGLRNAWNNAAATLEDLTREYGENATATAGQRIALREARVASDEAEKAYRRNQSAIKNTTSELNKLGVDTTDVVGEEQRLTNELAQNKQALADNREAIKQKRTEEKKAADTAKEHSDRVGSAREVLSDGARKVLAFAAAYVSLNAAFGLVKQGLALVAQGIRAVIDDGSEKQQTLAQLEATLTSTGNAAGLTAQQLLDMSDAMEAASMLSAEQVQAAQTRLLSYTDVAGKQFPRALQLVIDQQQRLGISVEQSAEIVGRALQSPAEAIATLGRQGFKLEDGQKRLLQQLDATGKKAEAQAIIMDMLTEAYGGAAAAARMNTFAGLLKGIGDRFGDFATKVGEAGVFDFIQNKLRSVSQALDEMASDGRLDNLAVALSNAFQQGAEKVEELARQLLTLDFKKLADDSAQWLNQFGKHIDAAVTAATMLSVPIRVAANVITGFISAVGTAFSGLIATSLSLMSVLAEAWPDAFGGKALVAGIETARGRVVDLMKTLAGQVAQDGKDLAATWSSLAGSAEESGERQAKAAELAAEKTRASMQKTGDEIASFFRSNITTLEQALAAISFSETAADLAEVESGLADSKLAAEELAAAMEALAQKRGFVTVADDAKRTTTELEHLRAEQGRLRAEYNAGNITLQQWQDGHNAAAKAIRKLEGESSEAVTTTKALGRELKTLVDVQRAIGDAKTDRDIAAVNAALKKMFDTGVISGAQYNAEMQKSAARHKEIKAAIDGSTKAQRDKNTVDKDAIVTSEQLRRESGKRMEAERKASGEAMEARRKGSADAQRDMSAVEDFYGGVMTRARAPLAALSDAVLAVFDKMRGIKSVDMSIDTSSIEATTKSLTRAREEMLKLQAVANTVGMSGLGQWQTQSQLQSQRLQVEYIEQKLKLQQLMDGYESGRITVSRFAAEARGASTSLNLLDDADLKQLESSIESAKQRMQQLGDSSRQTLSSLQDELDQLEGRDADIEQRRFESRRRELELQLAEAKAGGDMQAISNMQRALSTFAQIQAATEQQSAQAAQKAVQDQRAAQVPQQAVAPVQQSTRVVRIEMAGKTAEVGVQSEADETALIGLLEQFAARSI